MPGSAWLLFPPALCGRVTVLAGGELATLSTETTKQLDALLPAHWSRGNPVDILGDADAERYRKALEITLKDSESDGFLVILAPQGMTP